MTTKKTATAKVLINLTIKGVEIQLTKDELQEVFDTIKPLVDYVPSHNPRRFEENDVEKPSNWPDHSTPIPDPIPPLERDFEDWGKWRPNKFPPMCGDQSPIPSPKIGDIFYEKPSSICSVKFAEGVQKHNEL